MESFVSPEPDSAGQHDPPARPRGVLVIVAVYVLLGLGRITMVITAPSTQSLAFHLGQITADIIWYGGVAFGLWRRWNWVRWLAILNCFVEIVTNGLALVSGNPSWESGLLLLLAACLLIYLLHPATGAGFVGWPKRARRSESNHWQVTLAGESHTVNAAGGGGTDWPQIWVDGQPLPKEAVIRRGFFLWTRQQSFALSTHKLTLQTVPRFTRYHFDLAVNGWLIGSDKPLHELQPIPRWVWAFVLLFFVPPFFVHDGQGATILACAAALACLSAMQRERWEWPRQLATCIVLLLATGVLSVLLNGGLRLGQTTHPPGPWTTFTPPNGDFSIEMPGVPSRETRTRYEPGGLLDLNLYVLETDVADYIIGYMDYPPDSQLPAVRDILAEGQAAVAGNAEVVTATHITLGGAPGMDLELRDPQSGASAHMRAFVVGRRMYIILGATSREAGVAPDVNRFLNSFSVLDTGGRDAAVMATTTALADMAATPAAATAAVETATVVAFENMPTPTPDCRVDWRQDYVLHDRLNLQALAVRSATDAWVGGWESDQSGNVLTSIAHWDGRQWRTGPWPGLSATVDTIEALVAPGPNDLWAFASLHSGGPVVATHWDGQQWQDVRVPNTEPGNQDIGVVGAESGRRIVNAASASGPDDVWAVGTRLLATDSVALMLHWDGRSLREVALPSAWHALDLSGVTAVSANDVWASGRDGGYNQTAGCLLLHWDGANWRKLSCPTSQEGDALLFTGLTNRDHDIWALGTISNPYGWTNKAYLLHWVDGSWQPVMVPLYGVNVRLRALSASGPHDIWLAGEMQTGTGDTLGKLLHWNGQDWQEPKPDDTWTIEATGFTALQAAGPDDLWALSTNEFQSTGIWHYSDPCLAPTTP